MIELGVSSLWDKIYSEKSSSQLSWYEPSPTKSSELIGSLGIGRDSVIADVGCGESLLVEDLLELGFRNIIALDLSGRALSNLRERIRDSGQFLECVKADITSSNFPDLRKIDVWHDRAMLHFLRDQEQRKSYLLNLKRNLKIGGYAIFAEHSISGPEYCSGQLLHRYDSIDFTDFLGEGFTLLQQFKHDQSTPSGSLRNLIYSVFNRIR